MTSISEPSASISIVIPTFRRPERLERLLEMVLNQVSALQGSGAVEILVVDNCPERSAFKAVSTFDDRVRYNSEPVPGVANARNRGVNEALGDYVLFLDDDELPRADWLASFVKQANHGLDACFGPVEPFYEARPAPDLQNALDRLFSRRLPARTGQDISISRAWLGTGNSMFRKLACFDRPDPFSTDFNSGGEDVWFLRELVQNKNIVLTWCAEAIVDELVPHDRMSKDYVKQRIFKNGQLRCLIEKGSNGANGAVRVAFWMSVGVAQFLGYRMASILLLPFKPKVSTNLELRSAGGLGKLLWWR